MRVNEGERLQGLYNLMQPHTHICCRHGSECGKHFYSSGVRSHDQSHYLPWSGEKEFKGEFECVCFSFLAKIHICICQFKRKLHFLCFSLRKH